MEEFLDDGLRVRSIDGSSKHFIREDGIKMTKRANGTFRYYRGYVHRSGYVRASAGEKRSDMHRFVAKAFIANPNNYPMVDHIDNDGSNNHVNNLRWCTNTQNMSFYHKEQKGLNDPEKHHLEELIQKLQSSLNRVITENANLKNNSTTVIEEKNKELHYYKSLLSDSIMGNKLPEGTLVKLNITTVLDINGTKFKNGYSAARYITECEESVGNSRNVETIRTELKRFIKGNNDTKLMYGKYTIKKN